MKHRIFAPFLVMIASSTIAAAQDDELEFKLRQAKAINALAKKAFDKGFPSVAKVLWMKTQKLYDPENADAYAGLGYVKVGDRWVLNTKSPYPTRDTGDSSDGVPLMRAHDQLEKDLANQHRMQAEKWQRAGRMDMAKQHWQMVLRWSKEDPQAKKALLHVDVGDVSGSPEEKLLYERSKAVEKEVETQSKVDYEVKQIQDVRCEPLDQAQVSYITVRSEHFTLHGDADQLDNLCEALRWSERSLKICISAFPWKYAEGPWPIHWAFFTDKDTYHQILKANKLADLEWLLENSSTTGIGNVVVGATGGAQTLFDSCVRNVAQNYSGFGSTGFREGIGHTFVGMVFNNNRLFTVDRKRQQGTTTGEDNMDYQSPDFDVWKDLNLQLAWQKTSLPANRIAFCDAASFSNEERIKAWSFCDYMMRRDPEMLRTMDRIAQDFKKRGIKQPAEFDSNFFEAHKVQVNDLDTEWSNFWTGASPVLKAIQNNTPPVAAFSNTDKWRDALNAARKTYNRAPVLYASSISPRCKDHVEYLLKNKDLRDPASMHTQSVELGGSYIGSLFAQMALVVPEANVANSKKTLARWVYWPGYRDALLNNTLLTVGMYLEGNVLVINATSGIGTPKASDAGADCFPPRNDGGLMFDGEVPLEELGPEAVKFLEKHGRTGKKSIGFPLTLHFGSSGGIPARSSLKCNVVGPKGEPIAGDFTYDDGKIRTTSAPGMAVFWPFEPLPKGKISFQWTWLAGTQQQSLKGAFSSK